MAQESALFPFRAFSGQLEETNHTRIGVDDYDSNSDGSVSHLGLITHLADGLPDPPDDISEENDYLAETSRILSERIHHAPEGPAGHAPDQSHALGDPAITTQQEDRAQAVAVLNTFIVPNAKMDNLPPVSSAPVLKSKVKPSGALKRLSQKGGIYRGIRSYGRAQKVLKPVTRGTYDLDTSPVTTKRRTKAPSVDPESIDWSTRDTMSTAGAKKRRLKLASTSGSVTIEEKVRHAAGSKAQVLPRRSEGRSDRPTSREHKASRTPRVDDGGNLPVIDADRQAEAPSLKTRLMADPDTMEHDAMEGEQDLMSIGDQPDLPESTMANTGRSEPYKVSSDRQSGSRPRKEGSTGGRGPIHRLRNNASTSLSAKKRETASHRTSQDNDTQQTLELADQAHAGENVEPPTSVQAGQHSDERQRENSADAPEETAIAPQSVPSAMRVDKGPNDNSRDGPETGDDDNGSVDKITKDLESYNRLEEAYRALRSIGLKKDAGHDVRSKMPPIQTAAAREVLQACIEAKNRISKVGDQETPSTADADIRSHIMRTRTMASKIWEDTLWKQSWESVQDVFVFVIPTLTKLLRRLLRSFMFEREDDLSVDQLEISRLLMKTIVEGGRKAKGVTSKIKTDFPIKNIIKMGIVPNIAVALNGFQARLTFLQKIQMAEDEKRQAEIARQNAAVEEARRAEMRRQEAEIERRCEERQQVMQQWKRHWRDLHAERMRAELIGRALILSPDKLKQLEMVPLAEPGTTETVELDADGEPIELSQDFTTRQSQVPGQADTRLDWSIDESYALMKGLREAAGPRVYQKVFWRYCQRGQILSSYSVSEIVDQAVWIRDEMLKAAQQDDGEPEPWILQIPDPRVPPFVSSMN